MSPVRLPVPPPAPQNGPYIEGDPGGPSRPCAWASWLFAAAGPFPDADADPLHCAQRVKSPHVTAGSEYQGRRVSLF